MATQSLPAARRDTTMAFGLDPATPGRQGLRIHATTAGDAVFERFFSAYDGAFVLPDEKEDRAGFLACLALNHGQAYARLSARHGPFREWVLVAEQAGALAGGANFICHPLPTPGGSAPWRLAMNLNYVFVDRGHRGQGLLRQLLTACRRLAADSFEAGGAHPLPPLVFFELNDPLRMDAAAYAEDSTRAGLDQFDRVGIWARMGAAIIGFPYAQPPLSPHQRADHALVLGVIGADGPALDGCLLGAHLERFFSVSVLKGADARGQPDAAAQLALCEAACSQGRGLPLYDPLPALAELRAERESAPAGARRGLCAALAARGRTGE